MTKKEVIFNGKEKRIFSTEEDPGKSIIHYKDTVTAFGNIKRDRILGKGRTCCTISSIIFGYLNKNGIDTHFIEQTDECEMLCRRIELIPLEITVRNIAAGSLAVRLGLEEGASLKNTIIDLGYNCDELGDPMINCDEVTAMGIVSSDELAGIRKVAVQVNELLKKLYAAIGITLVDFKMEFGRAMDNGRIIVSDEFSPDTARLWDNATGERLDKDLFRHDLGDVGPAYEEVLRRLQNVKI